MKILVVGHTYISTAGREKWRVLAEDPDVDLRIIVPLEWKDYLFTLRFSDHPDPVLAMDGKKILFSGKEAAHCYLSATMGMGRWKPDIIHVEEGTDALSYYQILHLKRILAPRAKTLFFTWMNFEKTLRFPFPAIERYNLAHSDAAICGNRDAVELLRKKGYRGPAAVIPLLGVDPTLFTAPKDPREREAQDLHGVVLGFIGRFVEEKGVLDLITAASGLDRSLNYTLLFVGGGVLEDAMRKRAAELGIGSRLRIIPPVPHAEIPHWLGLMDALVLPSFTVPHWKEQFGQVLVQAMCREVAVLGSTHAEIPRVIGDAGLTFPERDVEALRTQLDRLVRDADLRHHLGEVGRQRVHENFTNVRIAERTMKVYRQVLGEEPWTEL